MFTGIIQAVGHVTHVQATQGGDARVRIAAGGLDMGDVRSGDSIACNGVCLTVAARTPDGFDVVVSGETFACTIGFAPGDRLNLEKALRLADRLGGHLVSGHVDGVGEVLRFEPVGDSWLLQILAPESLTRYLAPKGSVAVNGVSLTVNRVHGADFHINLIPHTLDHTMLRDLKAGSRVNLEADMLARYAERLLHYAAGAD
ncbi:MAG TPA: riboflavin synthase [Thiobacillaceae bacterium]|nr:riboflavin synthase [Thiobacillaceae bacterium]HNU65081.1 riboflavin synthase [Thiobacillaceae bacterium]